MRRVPNIKAVIAEAKRASAELQQEKIASVAHPDYTVPVAAGLLKLAHMLRDDASDTVTYDDVEEFGKRVLEECP